MQEEILQIQGVQTSMAMKNPLAHLVTAFPYIDDQISENNNLNQTKQLAYRSEAERLVREEMRKMEPQDYLKNLPMPSTENLEKSELIQKEFERIKNKEPMPPIKTEQYALPTGNLENIKDTQKLKNIIDKTKILSQHNNLRQINGQLLKKYGPDSYKQYISDLIKVRDQNAQLEKDTIDLEKEVIDVRRKKMKLVQDQQQNQQQ
ncbi:hypothetical protein PPERSA_08319 [Pseudocohnilembus persalinus]|uniref:Uncharacterized protein n=1 Tax=Pseudocohnilembus persalinus TaxID=266149 RepID=A0A0V0QPT1_PSEPJ|nr:hypothetical protein PPERSA_08319 [Pseudocohnilembus persalinus]|eukprot:KRX04104.1 hypothetical protein PPERSA_08319 [Pseudocohnilembus persalinus]